MRELDVCKLPLSGQHLVEASAGTGKTYNIALLYVRLLLEAGHALRNIAVVTFTDAATRDLRTRLRKQLVAALERLRGAPGDRPDELERILAAHRVDARAQQAAEERLLRALLEFDEAQIWTLHGLCARLLADLAFETGEPFAEIEAGTNRDALVELVRDFWRIHMIETVDVAFAAILERWEDPEHLAGFLIHSQVLALAPDCIDPADADGLAITAAQQLDAAVVDWRRCLEAGRDADAVASIEDLLASKLLSVDKSRNHHPAAMAALKGELDSGSIGVPDPAVLKPLSAKALAADRNKKLKDVDWQPEGALAEVAAIVDRLSIASDALERARVARFVRKAIAFVQTGLQARQSRLRLHGYDDLIGKLHRLLHGDDGARIASQIAARLPAILVDEFQDTDSLQYGILHRIHAARSDHGLFLVGDPKQAIYRFRGGDIFTYRKASEDAGARRTTLLGNWRSDARLIRAVNALFGGVEDTFLYPFIGFQDASFPQHRPVSAQEHRGSPPMTIWRMPDRRDDNGKVKAWTVGQACDRLLAEVCAEIKTLLRQSADSATKPSIAVLVNTNKQADAAAQALGQWNVPFEYLSSASVYASREASELETLIAAICAPGDAALVRAALATELLGEDLASLLAARDDLDRWEAQLARISRLRKQWLERGPFAMIAACVQEAAPRLLSRWDGRRMVTNLLHLGELLQQASMRRSSAEELLRWLSERRIEAAANRGEGGAEQIRAADAGGGVQVLTVHRSKGLQYDHVFAPFL
jgi:exodeoxyribonuclease V beta subunit